jgi:hypothetical protein|tara:strand:- start:382 stop:603 length:222 start_codon:yes stop_codon:yes gene_type:complete
MNQPRKARFVLVKGLDKDVVYKFESKEHRDKWVAENLWAIEGSYQNLTARQVDRALAVNKDTIYRALQENPND